MNEPRGRRPLRTTLTIWLRAIFRRVRPAPDPEQTANADRQGAGAVESGQDGASLPENSPGGRSGPPDHWLALAESKGPPQHWLDLIRARLGEDISKVRWLRGRALPPPPETQDAAPREVQPLAANEVRHTPPFREPDGVFPADDENREPFPPEIEPVSQADVETHPAPSAEHRPPAAMRMYPARAEPPQPAAQPRPAPPAQSQPLDAGKNRREKVPLPASQARPRAISLTDGRNSQPAEAPKPAALPLAPAQTSERPVNAQSPVLPAPTSASKTEDKSPQAKPEPAAREQGTPQVEAWPAWQGLTFAVPLVLPEPSAAPQKRYGSELPPPTRPNWPPPPVDLAPQQPAQPGAPIAWPVAGEPAQAAPRALRDLPANPAPAERWPALEPAADDALAGDDWENYQRNWQRLERLRREQQGQLWSEWPF